MKNGVSKYFIVILLIALIYACESDESLQPNNPLNGKTTALFNPSKSYGTVADIDGNIYKTIKIGNQIWMAENLRTTRYRNGDSVPNIIDNDAWANLLSGAYCNYNNTLSLDTIATYGRLYNYYAGADERGIAPKGWRVPYTSDWDILIEFLGGDSIAGGKLKEASDQHWVSPNRADNSCGFTAIPSGFRYKNEYFQDEELYNSYWALPGFNELSSPFLYLFGWNTNFYRGVNYKVNGYSIRCIKN